MDSSRSTRRHIGVTSQSRAASSRKRASVMAIEDSNHWPGAVAAEEEREGTRKRNWRHGSPDVDSTITHQPKVHILHRVACENGKDHHEHKSLAHYLDPPRLFNGDSKASTLRGRQPILDTEEYLEDKSDVSIITYKTYSCNDYHKRVKDQFEKLPMPMDPVIKHLRPYFFRLPKDGDEAEPQTQHMTIVSDGLIDAIIQITGMSRDRVVNLENPPNMTVLRQQLYYRRNTLDQDIRRRTTGRENHVTENHVTAFFDYVRTTFDNEYKEAESLFKKGRVTKSHLSKLFGPGEVLVTFQNGHPLAYISENSPEPDQLPLVLPCWSWSFDGLFWRQRTTLYVDWPSTAPEIHISDLSVYPLEYDNLGLKEQLTKRGKTFWKCRQKYHVSYCTPNPRSMQPNLRYMVDMETYKLIHGQEAMDQPLERNELDQDAMDKDEAPDEPFPMLLPAEIYGFGFHDRKWRALSVDRIDEIRWNEKAFERLVIDPDEKDLIKALVDVHTIRSKTNGENKPTDVIEGKGNGLIILLHGGPGTGKTLTAESVAEVSKRPLYRITCGDIGTDAEEIEKNLPDVLLFGTIWGCVLLLDEADVFLEERSEQDLQRNALVSVFLRAIEYYDGILILTSNRVSTFDEAFKSRIQLALHLPRLEKDSRFHIWNNFIDHLRETSVNAKVSQLKGKIKVLAKHRLNGREIRNTVKVALQLAQSHEETLEYRHFEQVIKVSKKFGKYLVDEHGHDTSQWIMDQEIRNSE